MKVTIHKATQQDTSCPECDKLQDTTVTMGEELGVIDTSMSSVRCQVCEEQYGDHERCGDWPDGRRCPHNPDTGFNNTCKIEEVDNAK